MARRSGGPRQFFHDTSRSFFERWVRGQVGAGRRLSGECHRRDRQEENEECNGGSAGFHTTSSNGIKVLDARARQQGSASRRRLRAHSQGILIRQKPLETKTGFPDRWQPAFRGAASNITNRPRRPFHWCSRHTNLYGKPGVPLRLLLLYLLNNAHS